MRQRQYTITSKQVHDCAFQLCQEHIQLRDHGPKCRASVLWAVIFWAAARISSLSAACAALRDAPTGQAVRNALNASLPPWDDLTKRLNRALVAHLPAKLRRRAQPLAIDLHLVPYHGEFLYHPDEIYRSQAKDGTTHFHAYATLYVLCKGQRFTVALLPVLRGEPLSDIVRGLLRLAAKVGLKAEFVLLDRGFYSVAVVRYLQAARVPFLMPVPCRGRKADHPRGPGGTRVFHLWKQGGWAEHTLKDADGRKATVRIGVKCRNQRGERGRHSRQALVYAFWGLKPTRVGWLFETYRRRFGIESSYRQAGQARIRTCLRDPVMRMLFIGVALLLRNVWVWLHWEVLSEPRRGGRRVHLNQLPLRAMLHWLLHVTEALLSFTDEVQSYHEIPA